MNSQDKLPHAAPERPIAELIERVLRSESEDVMTCLAADLNSFLMGLSLLSGRREVRSTDVRLLLERFKLTLAVARPSVPGPSGYAAPGQQRRSESAPGSIIPVDLGKIDQAVDAERQRINLDQR